MSNALRTSEKDPDVIGARMHHVVQGEYHIVDAPNIILTTLLGSCVSACIRDPVRGVGGMNHFLLPGDKNGGDDAVKYGVNAMELLINEILKRGGKRERLEAKLFGGANVMSGLSDIGAQNAAFAERFLKEEGISCVGHSLGGDCARRVRYWALTGRATQQFLAPTDSSVFHAEARKVVQPPPASGGDVELF